MLDLQAQACHAVLAKGVAYMDAKGDQRFLDPKDAEFVDSVPLPPVEDIARLHRPRARVIRTGRERPCLHCLIRPRRAGGYIAECLEAGLYYAQDWCAARRIALGRHFEEDAMDRAVQFLRYAMDIHRRAAGHFRACGLPTYLGRSSGYWWKRVVWHLARMTRAGRRYGPEFAVVARPGSSKGRA